MSSSRYLVADSMAAGSFIISTTSREYCHRQSKEKREDRVNRLGHTHIIYIYRITSHESTPHKDSKERRQSKQRLDHTAQKQMVGRDMGPSSSPPHHGSTAHTEKGEVDKTG
jgi:hypothetical protein